MNKALSERVLQILEWPAISRELASRCMTSPGKQALETLSPLEKKEAENRMAIISALKESSALGNPIDFPGINNISPLLDRTEKEAVLLLEELFDVRRFVTGSARVRSFLKEAAQEYPVLRPEYESIQALEILEEKLLPAMTDNGDLNEQRFPQLKKLRRGIIDTRGEIVWLRHLALTLGKQPTVAAWGDGRSLSLRETLEGARRAAARVARWPQWKRALGPVNLARKEKMK